MRYLFICLIIIWPQLGLKCSEIRPFSTKDTQMVPLQAQSISFKISLYFKENSKNRQIWVLPFICTDTIKSTEKILIFTFLSFLKFYSVKLASLEGIYALIILKHNIG